MKLLSLIATTLAALAAATPGLAQSLQVTVTAGTAFTTVTSGGAVALTAIDIGKPVLATVTVRNTGAATTSITGVSISGTTEMTLASSGFPVSLATNTTTSFGVQYLPASGNLVSAQVSIGFTAGAQSGTFPFVVNGTSPRLTYSYAIAPNGGVTDLNSGDRITFPGTNVGTSTTAIMSVQNRGTAPANLQFVTVSGLGFQLSGAPGSVLLSSGAQISLAVIFNPASPSGSQGLLTLTLASGTVSFPLTGTGTATNFTATYALADGVVNGLATGTTISFPAVDINATATATIQIANQGTGAGALSAIAVSGTGFRLTGSPALPANVAAGQALSFGIVFAPSQAGVYSGTFRIDLPGRSITGILAATTAASNISLAYIDPDTNNILPLRDGATLPFPKTATGASTSVTLVASNSGAGTGVIDSVAINASAAAFQLLNLPALPASVPPSQQLKFGVRFSPPQQQAFTGALLVSVNGHATTVNMQGQGAAPQFTYTYGAGATPAASGGTIPLGDTTVGQTTSVTVSMTNAGNADGQVAAVAVTGTGFSLADLPAVPFTVRAGGSQSFTLNFAPSQPGAATGRLTIGSDTFTVTGNGIGSRLTFSYTNTASAVPVTDGGIVIFPPIEVGKNEKLQFAIQNTGTSAASISSINLAAASTSFALDQPPAQPFNLDAGATATFGVIFTPGATGSLTATLRINNSSFTLSGSGTQPAALPAYQFQTPTGTLQPAQQPAIGLTLASSYPTALDGVLTLTFVSSVFTDDPAIQFATGGRTVNFTIPANSTQALFNGNTSMALQTGTTAGSIVIKPSFAMHGGGFDLTPPTPDALTIPIPRAAPQLLNASITSETTTGFTVVLSGYSTTRTMRQLDVQFTPKQGGSFSTSRLTIDVSTASTAWYQGAASQGTGGSFLAAIPFVLANGSSTDDLVHLLQSLSITATNDSGVSTAVTVPIP